MGEEYKMCAYFSIKRAFSKRGCEAVKSLCGIPVADVHNTQKQLAISQKGQICFAND